MTAVVMMNMLFGDMTMAVMQGRGNKVKMEEIKKGLFQAD